MRHLPPQRPPRDGRTPIAGIKPCTEIHKWLHLTPDIQLVQNQRGGDATAIIPGTRLVIDL